MHTRNVGEKPGGHVIAEDALVLGPFSGWWVKQCEIWNHLFLAHVGVPHHQYPCFKPPYAVQS